MTILTATWRQRLHTAQRLLRRAGLTVALISCTVVALSTIWGWITATPIDVAGPARSAVNRAALVGAYAQGCITRWLTATQAHAQTLADCWTLRDPIRLLTTPATTFYRLPVVYSSYGVRASALPARITGPGPGADAPLGYPVTLAAISPAFRTVAGFLTAYLTDAGGLDRYVTANSGLLPAADYRSATLTKLLAQHSVPDQSVPPDGTKVHALATVDAVTTQFAPRREDYPVALTVVSGRWTVAAVDFAPLLAENVELTPVLPTQR